MELIKNRMEWDASSHIENIAVLVTDRRHQRFGQLGVLVGHDWKEYGILYVSFPDGREEFHDGMCKGDPPSSVRTFYRCRNEKGEGFDEEDKGPMSLIKTYLNLRVGDLNDFAEQYMRVFGEPFR